MALLKTWSYLKIVKNRARQIRVELVRQGTHCYQSDAWNWKWNENVSKYGDWRMSLYKENVRRVQVIYGYTPYIIRECFNNSLLVDLQGRGPTMEKYMFIWAWRKISLVKCFWTLGKCWYPFKWVLVCGVPFSFPEIFPSPWYPLLWNWLASLSLRAVSERNEMGDYIDLNFRAENSQLDLASLR